MQMSLATLANNSNACPNSSRTNNRTSTTNGNGNSRRANATQLNAMHVIQPQQQQQQTQQQQLQQQYVPSPQPVQPVIVRAPNWTGNDAELTRHEYNDTRYCRFPCPR